MAEQLDKVQSRGRRQGSREPPLLTQLETYFGYALLVGVGRIRDGIDWMLALRLSTQQIQCEYDYAPLLSDFDNFYARRLKKRLDDCFARVVTGRPGRLITLLDPDSPLSGKCHQSCEAMTLSCLNFGSYNYLGFAEAEPTCLDATVSAVTEYGVSYAASQASVPFELHRKTEEAIAAFVGKEAAIVLSMGFSMNVCAIEALVDSKTLVVSDALNHASIRFGCRLAGAQVKVFKHNDVVDLEKTIRTELRSSLPSKILVIVEGIYSMEGTICDLPGIIQLKDKYKFSLFVDEAHSIGAIGHSGRGICEYYGIQPSNIDVLMGTFSKAFGAVGGYVAADREVVEAIRLTPSVVAGEMPTPVVLEQINSALSIIRTTTGIARVRSLNHNAQRLRRKLIELGFVVYGDAVSPVVPLVVFSISKMTAFSREMLAHKIAVTIVGYPATSMHTARVRLCVSAAHTDADIDNLVHVCDEIGDRLMLKYARQMTI